MSIRKLFKGYVLLMFVLFALAVLDLVLSYTPFTTLYGYVNHAGAGLLVVWAAVTLFVLGWAAWRYIFHYT